MSNPSATRLCPHWKQLDYRSRLCRGDSIVYRMAVPLRKHLPSVRESPKTKNFFGLVQIVKSFFSCHQSDTLKETVSWSRQVATTLIEYMQDNWLNRSDLSTRLGVIPQYVSMLLSGTENSYSLSWYLTLTMMILFLHIILYQRCRVREQSRCRISYFPHAWWHIPFATLINLVQEYVSILTK